MRFFYLFRVVIPADGHQLENRLSQLLHFLEVNLFERKLLISIFQPNPRKVHFQDTSEDKQLKLFDI